MVNKSKITTTDERLYRAFSQLRHEKEVLIEKPINIEALNKILRNNDNIVAISNGRNTILKKINDVNFDIYLKRIW